MRRTIVPTTGIMAALCVFGLSRNALADEIAVSPDFVEEESVIKMEVDRDTFLAELQAQGMELQELELRSDIRLPVEEERVAARIVDVLSWAHDNPTEYVPLMLELSEAPSFKEQLRSLKQLDEGSREYLLAERKQTIAAMQADFLEFAQKLGAIVGTSLTLRNRVTMQVPPETVTEVLSHPEVRDAFLATDVGEPLWNQQEQRDQTLLQTFHDNSYWGQFSTSIAVIDVRPSNDLNVSHLNWAATGVFGSRVFSMECNFPETSPGVCTLGGGGTEASHSTAVTGVARRGEL